MEGNVCNLILKTPFFKTYRNNTLKTELLCTFPLFQGRRQSKSQDFSFCRIWYIDYIGMQTGMQTLVCKFKDWKKVKPLNKEELGGRTCATRFQDLLKSYSNLSGLVLVWEQTME